MGTGWLTVPPLRRAIRTEEAMGGSPTTLYDTMGGMAVCAQLSAAFHTRVAADPELARIFPKDLTAASERLALYLAERLGGPATYTARRGKQSLRCRHAHLPIGSREAHAWLAHMEAAADRVGIAEAARPALLALLAEIANSLSDPLRELYELEIGELREALRRTPALAATAGSERMLLSEAAGRWDRARVEVLLECGADVRARDRLAHDALSRAAGAAIAGREAEGRAVVELLLGHGADPNRECGPGRNTPLHAAARRGTVEIAAALLAGGAGIEARDRGGETPLRRAVNCGKEPMVRLLLVHGADPMAPDHRGVTPVDAAQTAAMRGVLAGSGRSG